MRLVILGESPDPQLTHALAAAGATIEARALPRPPASGSTAALVAALRGAETALGADPPDAVVVASGGDEALGAVLVGVKLGIPTAWLRAPGGEAGDEMAARVADVTLDAGEPAERLAEAIGALDAPTLPRL